MPPIKIKCNVPGTIGSMLAQRTQEGASEGARFKDARTEEAFVKNLVRDSDLLPQRIKNWVGGVKAKLNFADASKRSFEELGDKNGAIDLQLLYKRHDTKSKESPHVAASLLEEIFNPIKTFGQLGETYRIVFARSNYERARRGLKTQHGNGLKFWQGEIDHLNAHASEQAKKAADDIFALLREVGKDLETKGLLPKGTVQRNGEYVPHDVIEFLERDNLMVQSKTFRLSQMAHGKQAHGSEKELYTDYHTSLMHYLVSSRQKIADGEFLGAVMKRFAVPEQGEYVEFGGKRRLKDVKDPDKYDVWLYDTTHWNAQRVQRNLGLLNKEDAIASAREIAPDITPKQAEILWLQKLQEMTGSGELVVLPKGLVQDLHNWEIGKFDPAMGSTMRTVTAAWKRNMVGRMALYTGMKHFRDMRGDFQQALRDKDGESLAMSGEVAKRLMGDNKGLLKKVFSWQTKGLNELAARGYQLAGKTFSFTEAEFQQYLAEAQKNGVLTGKFIGEATNPAHTIASTSRKLYSRLSPKKHVKVLGEVLNKFDEADHLIRNLESVYRLSKYIRDRQRGHSEASATKRNGDTFVDYQLLTPFESKWLRDGLFPFYTFRKGNTLAWTRKLFDPRTPSAERLQAWYTFLAFSAVPILWNHWRDPEGEEKLQNDPKNKYIANTFHLFMGRNEAGEAIYLTDPLPSSDIDRLLNLQQFANIGKKFASGDRSLSDAPGEVGKQFVNVLVDGVAGTFKDELNPLFKAPMELALNQSFFYRAPIRDTKAGPIKQAAQLGNYALKTWDRQYATMQGLFFNKADAHIDALRLLGTPINAHRDYLSKSNAEEAEAQLFGGVTRPQVPKENAFIEQYERLLNTELNEDQREMVLAHYTTIRQHMADRYFVLANERILARQKLIKAALKANGIDEDYSLLYELPDDKRAAIIEKIKDQKWYRKLTFVSDKDRRKVLLETLQEAGLQ